MVSCKSNQHLHLNVFNFVSCTFKSLSNSDIYYKMYIMLIKENEQLEDLQYNGLQIIQNKSEYRFTTDAVLLANFVRDLSGKTCVDLGTGSGVIAVLVAAKKNPKHVYAVELQPQLADMASRTVQYNGLEERVTVLCQDMRQVRQQIGTVECVVCNPPYRRCGSGEKQLADNLAICRHEVAITLEEVIQTASGLLNTNGTLYMVHQMSRLAEIICLCNKHNINVKQVLPVCSRKGQDPNLVLIRAVKCGKQDCVFHQPLQLWEGDVVAKLQHYNANKR